MKPKKQTPEVLAHLLQNYKYDPETGEIWRRAGSIHPKGYCVVAGSLGEFPHKIRWHIKAHRLAFLLMTGEELSSDVLVDHANADRSDNRWENLRPCTLSQNGQNRPPWGAVKSRGVQFVVRKGALKYRAQIGTHPNVIHLGDFDTEEEAANAYDAAARERYGEFARTNT